MTTIDPPSSGDSPGSPACRICGTPFEPFISFGRQPISNAFLTVADFDSEFFYELRVGACPACRMVQLAELVDPKMLFHEAYAFFSGTSKGMTDHFARFADSLRQQHLGGRDPFIVEIGSNDGIMLQHFAHDSMRHLGVEPSANVAEVARAKGVRTICRFFDESLAREILDDEGPADVIAAANVMCHIADLHSVLRGVRLLLKPAGVFIFEDPYLGDIILKTSYDQIYDEHAFYFSITSLSRLFAMHDMEIVDIDPQTVHGGSIRWTVMHRGAGRASPRVPAQFERERAVGLDRDETFADWRGRVEASRRDLLDLLGKARMDGKRIVGYAATAKSATVTNYCGIDRDLVESISDTTPIKQGKYSPGMHIPVRPYAEFQAHPPDYALLFAWNHADEILAKEQGFVANGGRLIVYVPRVGIVP